MLDDEGILQSVEQNMEMIVFTLQMHRVEQGLKQCKGDDRVTRENEVRCRLKCLHLSGNGQTNENLILMRNFSFILLKRISSRGLI